MRWRGDSGGPLLLDTQLTPGPLQGGPGSGGQFLSAPGEDPRSAPTHPSGVWRYRDLVAMPISRPISLGEGATPEVEIEWGGASVWAKLEWFSPTGSFKDRGASVMLSALREFGATSVIEDSSGNGGAAVAIYAAAGGLEATIVTPAHTSPAKLAQAEAAGARIARVEGPREASPEAAISMASQGRGVYASHNWQAWFLEGTKTLAYEIWEAHAGQMPDVIVTPVGAGSSLLGLWIGFRELVATGLLASMPRLYAAQPVHCSPVDAAFRGERERPVQSTIAEGTAIRAPLRLPLLVDALRESGGGSVAVSEREIVAAQRELARRGLFVEPTSAVAAAGLMRLLEAEEFDSTREHAVMILTGSGLKTGASEAAPPPLTTA